MLFFLGLCFLLLTYWLTEIKVSGTSKLLQGLYLGGLLLVDLALLAMMGLVWAAEQGKL